MCSDSTSYRRMCDAARGVALTRSSAQYTGLSQVQFSALGSVVCIRQCRPIQLPALTRSSQSWLMPLCKLKNDLSHSDSTAHSELLEKYNAVPAKTTLTGKTKLTSAMMPDTKHVKALAVLKLSTSSDTEDVATCMANWCNNTRPMLIVWLIESYICELLADISQWGI